MRLEHIVSASEDGLMLQQLLRGPMGLSGREIRTAKQRDAVSVDAAPFFSNQPVREGMCVCVELADYSPTTSSPQAQPLEVIFEDEALLAVFKPAPLQCHPSPSAPGGSDTLEGRVCAYLGRPAHPVHRLDAETTGIVLFAKLPFVQAHLQRQMQVGSFEKVYRAWVYGTPEPQSGEIDAPIARLTEDSFTRVVRNDGQRAVTRYAVLRVLSIGGETVSLLSMLPLTGRTHQLRVHASHIGCPLLGDTRYASGESARLSDSLSLAHHQLSAVSLAFVHPVTHARVSLSHPAVFDFNP